jgi:hypothetical protein
MYPRQSDEAWPEALEGRVWVLLVGDEVFVDLVADLGWKAHEREGLGPSHWVRVRCSLSLGLLHPGKERYLLSVGPCNRRHGAGVYVGELRIWAGALVVLRGMSVMRRARVLKEERAH